MTAKWASFILLFLCTLGLGVLATDLNSRPISAVLICSLYLIAYVMNSFVYGLELLRKEQRLLNRVGYHGLVFFRGSQIESSEREKAEKLFIRQTTQGDMGRFLIGAVILLCLGAVAVIRKKAPDQMQLSTMVHFISVAVLACSFSMNHYFLSLAINACAVFIFISQQMQDPKFVFFQEPTGVLSLIYIVFVFGFTGIFYRFLEFFQFGFELKNVRRMMSQGWISGFLFLVSFFLFNGLLPDSKPKGEGGEDVKLESKSSSMQIAQTVDRMMAQAIYGKSEARRTAVTTTTTLPPGGPGSGSNVESGGGAEDKIVQGLKKSLERQVAEMDALNKQQVGLEREMEMLKAASLGSGETQEARQQKVQELRQKSQEILGEMMGRENRVADLKKHLGEKGALPPEGVEAGRVSDIPLPDGQVKAEFPTEGKSPDAFPLAGIDPEKEKREIEELRQKIAEIEAAQAQAKAKLAEVEAHPRSQADSEGQGPEAVKGAVQETPEAKAARLAEEQQIQQELARMKEMMAKKEELVRSFDDAQKKAEALRNETKNKQKDAPNSVRSDPSPPTKTRILTDAQLEMILKVLKILFLGGVLIGLVFGVVYFLNRNSEENKDRNLYQAAVDDPERYRKELKFLDQKGLSPQQEVILKYNLFLRFLRSVDLPKEDWQTVDQFNEDLLARKRFDPAVLNGLRDIFGKVCYGGYRPGADEIQGFRASVDQLVNQMTAQFKKELLAVSEDVAS